MALKHLANTVYDLAKRAWNGPLSSPYYRYDPRIDFFRSLITRKITFSRLESIIQGGRDGELADALQLYEEMEERDLRLLGISDTRRRAVTMLDWEVVSAAEVLEDRVDRNQADEAADYVREILDGLQSWPAALEHFSKAVGPNLAVLETVWQEGHPVDIFPIPSRRLRMDLMQSEIIRVITAEDRTGKEALGPKFIVHIPDCRSGSPIARSLSSAQGWIWLIKKLALSDWATFSEIFGMPVRVGRYDQAATPEERNTLEAMLKGLGPSGWAMMSKAVEIEFAESSGRGTSPHESLVNFANREMAVAWLGGNLTSDTTGGTGTHAAASEQNELRDDLRDDDIQREGRTVRDQFFGPIVRLSKNPNAPIPYFQRTRPETVDRIQEATLFKSAQGAGIAIPKDWAYARLNIPKPKDGEEVLQPPDAFADALSELPFGAEGTKPRSDEATKGKGADEDEGDDE